MILPGLKLQTRTLALSIGMALVPFLLLGIGVFREVRSNLLEKAEQDHRSIVSRLLHSIERDFDALQRAVELLGMDERVQTLKPELTHDALHSFLSYNESFQSIYVYDRAGILKIIEYRNHFTGANKLLGKSVKDMSAKLHERVNKVLTTGKPATYDYLRKESSESQLLMLAQIPPFNGTGSPVGAVSCAIQMYSHQFQDLLDEIDLEGGSYTLVLDRKGRVLARRGKTPVGQVTGERSPTGLPPVLAAVQVPGWDFEKPGDMMTGWMQVAARQDLITVASVPRLGATVLVGRPAAEVLGLLDRISFRILLFAILGLGLAVAGALTLSRSLVGPILELTDGIRKVGDGATGHRVRVSGHDELAQAGEAFNRMAVQLQKGKLMEQIWSRQWEDQK
jgi:HAMP domain-containing protein